MNRVLVCLWLAIFVIGCSDKLSESEIKSNLVGRWLYNPGGCEERLDEGAYDITISSDGITLNGIKSFGNWTELPQVEMMQLADAMLIHCNSLKIKSVGIRDAITFKSFENNYTFIVYHDHDVFVRVKPSGKLEIFTRFDFEKLRSLPKARI